MSDKKFNVGDEVDCVRGAKNRSYTVSVDVGIIRALNGDSAWVEFQCGEMLTFKCKNLILNKSAKDELHELIKVIISNSNLASELKRNELINDVEHFLSTLKIERL